MFYVQNTLIKDTTTQILFDMLCNTLLTMKSFFFLTKSHFLDFSNMSNGQYYIFYNKNVEKSFFFFHKLFSFKKDISI